MIPLLLATMVVLTLETALAAFVATRAWDYRPARLFVPLVASLSLLNLLVVIRRATDDLAVLYVAHAVATLVLAALCATLLLFFSALFVPQWWEGARPIRWIALPYALALPMLALDLFGRLGLIVRGLRFNDGISRLDTVQPGGSIALVAVISAPGGDGLAPRTLASLGRAGAHVLALAQGTASYHISFILPEAEVDAVVTALHRDLGLAAQ